MILVVVVAELVLLALFTFEPPKRGDYVFIMFGVLLSWIGVVALYEWKVFPE